MLGRGLEALIPPQGPQSGSPYTEPEIQAPLHVTYPAMPFTPQEPELQNPSPVPLMLHVHDESQPEELVPYHQELTAQHVEPYQPVMSEPVASTYAPPVQASVPPIEPVREASRPDAITQRPSNPFIHTYVSQEESRKPYEAVFQIDIDKIHPNPHQPRKIFDETALRDLAASIREFGILQPLVVSKVERETERGTEVGYEIIAGERRYRASKLVGLPRVPAIVRQMHVDRERLELAIIENLQREQLNAVEMARAYARLQDEFNMTQREVAMRLGKSREVVANTLRLLDLPSDVQTAIEDGRISESHGRLLLGVTDPALQQSLFADLLQRQLTTRELRERVAAGTKPGRRTGPRTPRDAQPLSPELQMLQERLASELGAPVRIQASGDVGKITISFYSREELSAILERLAQEADVLL